VVIISRGHGQQERDERFEAGAVGGGSRAFQRGEEP
jgi:hypothetical protein